MRTTVAGLLATLVSTQVLAAGGERLLVDFSQRLATSEVDRATADDLVQRYPSLTPCHIEPGVTGIILPSLTQASGAFTASGARQTAIVIDYCPTGTDVRPRRLLVTEGGQVVLDQLFPDGAPGSELVLASDVTGDGLDELVLTSTEFHRMQPQRNIEYVSVLQLTRGGLRSLGRWVGADHCTPGEKSKQTLHTLHVTPGKKPSFRDVARTSACVYPP